MALWTSVKRQYRIVRDFLVEDKSVWSWLANLLLAFVIIKYLVYPVLGLLFGASLPVVAVVSSSMDHNAVHGVVCGTTPPTGYRGTLDQWWDACGSWYSDRGITRDDFSSFSLRSGFAKGDIMVITGYGGITLGDVLVYEANQQYPIIHRIVAVHDTPGGTVYATKGDHNVAQIQDYVVVNSVGAASRCHRNGEPMPCGFGALVNKTTPGAIAVFDETDVHESAVIGKAVLRIPLLGWVKIWFTDALYWLISLVT